MATKKTPETNPTKTTPDATANSVKAPAAPVPDEVTAKLAGIKVFDQAVIDRVKALGVETADDFALLKEEHLIAAGLNAVQAAKLLRPATAVPATPMVTDTAGPVAPTGVYVGLDNVPDYTSISASLRTNGVLNITPVAAAYAIMAAVAPENIFDAPQTMDQKIEQYCRRNGKKAPAGYLETDRPQLLKTIYAEILHAAGITNASNIIPKPRRDALIKDVREGLLPALRDFFQSLTSWRKDFRDELQDNFMLGFAGAGLGGGAAALIDEPSVLNIRASLEVMVDKINRVMAFDGEPIGLAIGAEASRVTTLLKNEKYWPYMGCNDLDEVKALLGIRADSMTDMTETNLTRFAYNALLLNERQNFDPQIIGSLVRCGKDINWSSVGGLGLGITGGGVPHVGETGRL